MQAGHVGLQICMYMYVSKNVPLKRIKQLKVLVRVIDKTKII